MHIPTYERDSPYRTLYGAWNSFRVESVLHGLRKNYKFVKEMHEWEPHEITELYVFDDSGSSIFKKRPDGFKQIGERRIVKGLGFGIRQTSGDNMPWNFDRPIYTIVLDEKGFYGRYRDLEALFIGETHAVRGFRDLRLRVNEHIEHEKGGRKSLLDWIVK